MTVREDLMRALDHEWRTVAELTGDRPGGAAYIEASAMLRRMLRDGRVERRRREFPKRAHVRSARPRGILPFEWRLRE